MALEDVLMTRLENDAPLAALLARWNGTPAIFAHEAPDDTDPGWENGIQYPRIIFELQRSSGVGDVMQGTLHVTIWARDGQGGSIEAIVAAVRRLLDASALYASEDGLAALAAVPQAIPMPRNTEGTRVIGVDLIYRLQVMPPNTTYEPDPVATLNRWSTDWLDNRITIAPNAWAPSDSNPAVYWRLISDRTRPADMEWWGFWVDVELAGHVLAPSAYARNIWARYVSDTLRLPTMRKIRMGDGGPLIVNAVEQVTSANPREQGQVRVSARFGMRTQSVPAVLDNPPVVPPGPVVPPPVWDPGVPPDPTWSPPIEYVSNVDTGQPLDTATLDFVPDVETLPQPDQ